MALSKATLIDLNSNELILDLDADTSITADTDDTIHIKIAGSDELTLTATAIAPSTSDGQALGTSSLMFSDLFLASGSVLNFNNGDVTLTHASNNLILDGGSLDLDGESLILDADGDTKIAESSDDVIHLTFAGSTSTPTEFGAGYINLKNQGTQSYIRYYCESSNAHYTQLQAAAHSDYSGNATVTLPVATSTLATTSLSETFTNKTLTSPNIGTSIELLARAEARFQDASGGQFVALEAPATVSSSFVLTLPDADGSSGQFLRTDGSGALSFATVSTSTAFDDVTAGDAAVSVTTTAGNITIDAQGNDTDIILKGTDGGADTTFLTIDGSAAGKATFNNEIVSGAVITSGAGLVIADAGTIGSASDTDAISIGSDGDVTLTQDLELQHDAAELTFGANDEIKLIHNHDKGLILKHTATADDKPVVLTLQTGETDMAADDVMGKIEFQAPDEGTGTDAILVSAAIQARAEGDFSSSSNATSLEFMTGSSEAAAAKMTINSDGEVGIGTTNPTSKLHISDNANYSLKVVKSGSNIHAAQFSSNGTAALGIAVDESNNQVRLNSEGSNDSLILEVADGTDAIVINSDGHVTKPQNPSASYRGNSETNFTGDGTQVTVGVTSGAGVTELFDVHNDLSGGTFTAPVTGKYLISGQVFIEDISSNHDDMLIQLETSNRTYYIAFKIADLRRASADSFGTPFVALADMDANDTFVLKMTVSGGSKIIDMVDLFVCNITLIG